MLASLLISVLNMSLAACYVVLFVIIARLMLKKAPKVFSYALWAVVLFRLFCPFSFESAIGLLPNNAGLITPNIVYQAQPQINIETSMIANSINSVLLATNDTMTSINYLQIWIFICSNIWIIGIATILIYSITQLIKLKKQLVGATPLRDNIYLVDHISSPFVMGIFKVKIYLPSMLSDNEQDFIIAHEKNHIKRFDHITRLLGFIALTIHWFNPLVWIAFFLSGKDMEMSCDEAVINKMKTDIRSEYSQSLLRFATGRKVIRSNPISFCEGDTKERVKNVMKYKKPATWITIIGVIAIVCLVMGLATNQIETKKIQDGTYAMMVQGDGVGGSVTIDGDTFTFRYDLLRSYLPYGKYQIKGDILTLSTNDGKYKYIFKIDGDDLIFQETGSSTVELTDTSLGVQVVNGSMFRCGRDRKWNL